MPEGTAPETDPKKDEKSGETAPPWGDDFDAERAWRLVQNLRDEVAGVKKERDEARSERDEFRTAAEKSGEERDEALKKAVDRAENAERTLAIRKHNLPDDVVEEFADYLTGTPDEVDAKAARLAARLAKEPSKSEGDGGEGGDKPGIPSRPQAQLVPGNSGGDETPKVDPVAIAAKARARM